jgi:DNA (cytosine-5)-methyltransferase 1
MIGNPMSDTLGTITSRDSQALHTATLSPEMDERAKRTHAFLIKYYGTGIAKPLWEPLGTITTRDRFALVEVQGVPHAIVDIGMRMIQPDELYLAQGFPAEYRYAEDAQGVKFTKGEQIAAVGNSVCPDVARQLVAAQRH